MHATVHTRCIVDDDTADHSRTDAGRIGREYASIRFQNFIDTGSNDTWLQLNRILIRAKFVFLPMLACHDEYAVRAALS